MDTIISQGTINLDDLYTRYSCRLLAAATERLAAIGPSATEFDEDLAQEVWTHVAERGLPQGQRGLDALLAILDRMVRKIRRQRTREIPTGISPAARRIGTAVQRDIVVAAGHGDPTLTNRVSEAVAALRALPLAG